jgi:hypothetical protein
MALNAEDRNYISKINEDTKKHIEQIHDLKMNLILQELGFIRKQTTETNGKVLLHTSQIADLEKLLVHTTDNCPNKKIIEDLRLESLDDKSKKRVLGKQRKDFVLIITITGIVFALIEFLIKFFIKSSA